MPAFFQMVVWVGPPVSQLWFPRSVQTKSYSLYLRRGGQLSSIWQGHGSCILGALGSSLTVCTAWDSSGSDRVTESGLQFSLWCILWPSYTVSDFSVPWQGPASWAANPPPPPHTHEVDHRQCLPTPGFEPPSAPVTKRSACSGHRKSPTGHGSRPSCTNLLHSLIQPALKHWRPGLAGS